MELLGTELSSLGRWPSHRRTVRRRTTLWQWRSSILYSERLKKVLSPWKKSWLLFLNDWWFWTVHYRCIISIYTCSNHQWCSTESQITQDLTERGVMWCEASVGFGRDTEDWEGDKQKTFNVRSGDREIVAFSQAQIYGYLVGYKDKQYIKRKLISENC